MADEQDVVTDAQNVQLERPHALRDPRTPSQEVQECNIAHILSSQVMVSILRAVDRQETSIINDEVNARTVRQRLCSPVASWVLRAN